MENTFVKAFKEEENRTLTANGANTYKSSLNANLDFFGQAGAMRGQEQEYSKLFFKAFSEDWKMAIKNIFYMRDIRNGVGERQLFIDCFNEMCRQISDEQFAILLPFIPEYGRWSDVFDIMQSLDRKKYAIAIEFLKKQLKEDLDNIMAKKPISLMCKWFPLANNRHIVKEILAARKLASNIFGNDKKCRKVIVSMRRYIDVLEQKVSANEWGKIDYSTVPSLANLKYRSAFIKHDYDRFTKYIDSVNSGEAKINASVSTPADIIRKFINGGYYRMAETISEDEVRFLDTLWNNLKDYTNGSSSIAVVDISGSMFGAYSKSAPIPVSVSVSLGIYFAERNKSEFQNMMISFSDEPECKLISGRNIAEKFYDVMSDDNLGYNTNLIGVFEAYLELAKKSKPEDCPKNIVIISDMEFDTACADGYEDTKATIFQKIDEMFQEAGIEKPNLIFWNVNASGKNVPVKRDEYGTVLVSGYSPAIFQYVCDSKSTPEGFMIEVLSNYDKVVEKL